MKDMAALWHRRFAHRSKSQLKLLASHCFGAEILAEPCLRSVIQPLDSCMVCPGARLKHAPHPKHKDNGSRYHGIQNFGDCVSTDHIGKLPESFQHGYQYGRVFVDLATGDYATYCQKTKTAEETVQITKLYEAHMAVAGTVKRYHSDGAKELMGSAMWEHCLSKTPPSMLTNIVAEHPNLNNMAEGSLWILFSMVRAMLIESQMDKAHWPVAFTYSGYLYRRSPKVYKRLNKVSTPYELLYGHAPDISTIRLFGCVCHALLSPSQLKKTKLNSRVVTGAFVGFSRNKMKGVLVWVPHLPKYVIAYTVKTDETRMFSQISPEKPMSSLTNPDALKPQINDYVEVYWTKECKWYSGKITGYTTDTTGDTVHSIQYDDWPKLLWHNFNTEEWRVKQTNGPAQAAPTSTSAQADQPDPVSDASDDSDEDEQGLDADNQADPTIVEPETVDTQAPQTRVRPPTRSTSLHVTNNQGSSATSNDATPGRPAVTRSRSALATTCSTPRSPTTGVEGTHERVNPVVPSTGVEGQPNQECCGTPAGDRTASGVRVTSQIQEPASGVQHNPRKRGSEPARSETTPLLKFLESREHPNQGRSLADLLELTTGDTERTSDEVSLELEREVTEALASRVAVYKMVAGEDGASLQPRKVPRNFREATKGEDADLYWGAMKVEIEHHKRAGTWTLVPRPQNAYVIGSTWSYDLKLNGQQQIKKGKGRLCAQGFAAREGVEYMFKYSSTAGLDTFRLFFAQAAYLGWPVYEADYSTAYLNAQLDTHILMKQPQGFEETGPDGEEMVCLLQRAIYGLPQSGRLWQATHTQALLNHGFERCTADHSLFRKEDDNEMLYLMVNVDNLYMTSSSEKLRKDTLQSLQSVFELNDLGLVEHTLGVRVKQNTTTRTTTLDQEQYIKATVKRFLPDGYPNSKRRTIPCDSTITDLKPLDKTDPEIEKWYKPCLRLGGSLNWIVQFTRPDAAYALNCCMRCVGGASEAVYQHLMNILIFLDITSDRKITYGYMADAPIKRSIIEHTADVRHDIFSAGDPIVYVDTGGGPKPVQCVLILLYGGMIGSRISRQTSTTLSQCEAEWFGATTGATMILGMEPLLSFFNAKFKKPFILLCDNKAACMLSDSNHSSKRMRHVATRLAFLQERVESGDVLLVHIGTSGNLADIGTKALNARIFHNISALLYP